MHISLFLTKKRTKSAFFFFFFEIRRCNCCTENLGALGCYFFASLSNVCIFVCFCKCFCLHHDILLEGVLASSLVLVCGTLCSKSHPAEHRKMDPNIFFFFSVTPLLPHSRSL